MGRVFNISYGTTILDLALEAQVFFHTLFSILSPENVSNPEEHFNAGVLLRTSIYEGDSQRCPDEDGPSTSSSFTSPDESRRRFLRIKNFAGSGRFEPPPESRFLLLMALTFEVQYEVVRSAGILSATSWFDTRVRKPFDILCVSKLGDFARPEVDFSVSRSWSSTTTSPLSSFWYFSLKPKIWLCTSDRSLINSLQFPAC